MCMYKIPSYEKCEMSPAKGEERVQYNGNIKGLD